MRCIYSNICNLVSHHPKGDYRIYEIKNNKIESSILFSCAHIPTHRQTKIKPIDLR